MSFPFSTGSNHYPDASVSRHTRLRSVKLTHIPATSPSGSQLPASQPNCTRSANTVHSVSETAIADPFLNNVSPPSSATPASSAQTSNLAKWSAFGLNIARYAGPGLSPPPQQQQQQCLPSTLPSRAQNCQGRHQPRSTPTQTTAHVEARDQDGEILFCGSSVSSLSRGNSQPPLSASTTPVMPAPTSVTPAAATMTTTTAANSPRKNTGAMAALRRQLCELSNRVSEAAEWERCRPPRPTAGGYGRGGGRQWHRKARKTDGGTTADARKEDVEYTGADMANTHEEDHSKSADGPSEMAKGGGGRKRGRVPAGKPTRKHAMGGRKGRKNCSGNGDEEGSSHPGPWQTLFPLPGGSNGSGTGGKASNESSQMRVGMGEGDSASAIGSRAGTAETRAVVAAASAAAVPITRLVSRSESDALYRDVEASLNDPDRIQAPRLFLGILFDGGETNFSLSSRSHGKGLMPLDANKNQPLDPKRAHRYVADLVVRWRERVIVLAAQPLGFDFILRVLRELVGVELITFSAPAVLLPLLSASAGELTTHCVSDVRVMAWMASLSTGGGVESESSAPAVVYDFAALFDLYSGGKTAATALSVAVHHAGFTTTATATTVALQRLANETFHLGTVYRTLYGLLGSRGLLQAFLRQEKRIPLLVATMKREGVRVDQREVQRFRAHCLAQMQNWRERALTFVPELVDFNIQSPDQVRVALYEVLHLGKFVSGDGGNVESEDGAAGSVKHASARYGGHEVRDCESLLTTKGGKPSTAEETLRVLAKHHEFPQCVINYRKVAKILHTYVEGMMSFAIPITIESEASSGTTETAKALPEEGKRHDVGHTEHPIKSSADDACISDTTFKDVALISHNDSSGAPSPNAETTMDDIGEAAEDGSGRRTSDTAGDLGVENNVASPSQRLSLPLSSTSATGTGASSSPPAFARLHPNFLQEGTDTGRFSCVEPNLQNIPRTASWAGGHGGATSDGGYSTPARAPPLPLPLQPARPAAESHDTADEVDGQEPFLFRRCFVAPPGYTLLSVDYQQIELRVLAHLCGDRALIAALSGGNADIHRTIAEIVFRKSPVSAEERNLSKRVTFGILYGAGPRTLAAQMGVSVERAMHVAALLKSAFPQINTYHQRIIEQGREEGYVRTLSGRMRHLPDLNSPVVGKRAYAERQAFNTVVQGSAADVMKMAMLAAERDVLGPLRGDVRLLMQIHDEMVFAVRSEKLAAVVPMVSRSMSRAMSLLVPLHVTAKFGPSLGDFQEWTIDHELGLA